MEVARKRPSRDGMLNWYGGVVRARHPGWSAEQVAAEAIRRANENEVTWKAEDARTPEQEFLELATRYKRIAEPDTDARYASTKRSEESSASAQAAKCLKISVDLGLIDVGDVVWPLEPSPSHNHHVWQWAWDAAVIALHFKYPSELPASLLDVQCLSAEDADDNGSASPMDNGPGNSSARCKYYAGVCQWLAERLAGVVGQESPTTLQVIEQLERKTPPLDTKSIEWLAAREENEEKFGLPVKTLREYRTASKGGRKMPDEMFGIDGDGRRWRRRGTQKSNVYYYIPSLPKR